MNQWSRNKNLVLLKKKVVTEDANEKVAKKPKKVVAVNVPVEKVERTVKPIAIKKYEEIHFVDSQQPV